MDPLCAVSVSRSGDEPVLSWLTGAAGGGVSIRSTKIPAALVPAAVAVAVRMASRRVDADAVSVFMRCSSRRCRKV
jgi:hypothetical protein